MFSRFHRARVVARWAVRVMALARFSRNVAQIHKDRVISPSRDLLRPKLTILHVSTSNLGLENVARGVQGLIQPPELRPPGCGCYFSTMIGQIEVVFCRFESILGAVVAA